MLTTVQREKVQALCKALLNQEAARVIIESQQRATGFWFGGGNMVVGPDGAFYVSGRYRNYGDSRTGLGVGERGLELAIFKSTDQGQTFTKVCRWRKADLNMPDETVLSIEGSALHFTSAGVELFVSSEKKVPYPAELVAFQKPMTGVWTMERLFAKSVAGLRDASITPLLRCEDARFLHVKDPVVYDAPNGDMVLAFCTHPFNWASSNSGYCVRPKGAVAFSEPVYDFFRRGFTWDVAISRITGLLPVPRLGVFADVAPMVLAFYDGGESMRNYDEHTKAVRRP